MAVIKRLWVAEKPLVAKALVKTLCRVNGVTPKHEKGFTRLSNGEAIVPLWGHMIEPAKPGTYVQAKGEKQSDNYFDYLPIVPEPFIFVPKKERTKEGKEVEGKQIKVVEKLAKQAKVIVNACDIDREGQLIFDELIQFFGMDPAAANFQRVVINSMTDQDLANAVQALEQNGQPKWVNIRYAAQTRQAMDWLLGMNASMAMQQLTGVRTMSVGRVQTPVLAMVVNRDLEIEHFKPTDYYTPVIQLENGATLRWQERLNCQAQSQSGSIDSKGRILDLKLAQGMLKAMQNGQTGIVQQCEEKVVNTHAPLPFSMGSLQTFVAKQYDLNVSEISAAAKSLYENHQAITYIGTDCEYYPESLHAQAPELISKISRLMPEQCAQVQLELKSRAFNDEKLDEHYALAPTLKAPDISSLSKAEAAVYEAICKRFIAQFYPPHIAKKAVLSIHFGDDHFRANAQEVVQKGWRALYQDQTEESEQDNDEAEDRGNTLSKLMAFAQGECVKAVGGKIQKGTTTAPQRYTEGTLIEDMKNASKFARSEQERAMLKESIGIGTSRTRDVVISNLINRQFLERKKKKGRRRDELYSTDLARQLIGRLPAWLTDVATTARWEMILASIAKGEAQPDAALKMQQVYVCQVVDRIKAQQKVAA